MTTYCLRRFPIFKYRSTSRRQILQMKLSFNIFKRGYCSAHLNYEIPNEYHNSFYLANASLLQIANYFIHSSYKCVFPELVETTMTRMNCSPKEASERVRNYIKRLDRCEAMVDLHLPLHRYHSGVDMVRANRVYHALSFHQKSLGGLRIDPDLVRQQSQGFAAQATYRNALFGIDMAGAAGGMKISPYVLEPSEMRSLLVNYLQRIPKFENLTDIIEPDLGSTHAEMDMLKESHQFAPHVLAMGKSEEAGGHPDHQKAGGKCATQCLKQFLEHSSITKRFELSGELSNKTYILEGLGKIGKQVALNMAREGAKCVGIREHDCIIYDPAGIHVKALFKHLSKYGTIRGFSPKCREYDFDSIFSQPCDILILAAMERCISCNIADKIQARVVVEVANLPVTPTAYKVLLSKNCLVIPGLLAGAGPTLLSYLEHQMTLEQNQLHYENVPALFQASLQTVIDDVIDIEEKMNLKLNFLAAAYVRAIRNLFKRIIDKQIAVEKASQKMIGMQS